MRVPLVSFIAALLFCSSISFAKETLTLVTHESPPYMSETLPDQGAMFYALRKVLKEMGYDLRAEFAPSWTRTKMLAETDPKIDGYAPYRVPEKEDVFVFSNYLFESPWMIGERKDHPIHWKSFDDLTAHVAGNQLGVELRPGTKELVEQKKLRVETTSSQTNNILKLATKRVDFVFTDPLVFRYLVSTDPTLRPYKNNLQLNPKPVVIEKYGIALKKSFANSELLKTLNNKAPELKKYVEEYIAKIESQNKK
ncbi:ABC transporter substrate-binding protein [Bdellovibrio sp. 22V]|uniref:substrate-binding periplasmic protein n=1 Tax=Bdellovibrio TaxID=958 RepID=UPI0025436084|nr:ABC transporter substrate-binding protein [Bdellovibrio sp. 22V]WII71626.1 ABC transporter substrate-binding protein [Bdellovibrio sp. 22V]